MNDNPNGRDLPDPLLAAALLSKAEDLMHHVPPDLEGHFDVLLARIAVTEYVGGKWRPADERDVRTLRSEMRVIERFIETIGRAE